MKTLKSALTWSVVVTTIAWSVGASLLVAPLAAGATATLTAGSLIKGSLPAVYYYGGDGKRYVFPNEATYKTWYADFAGVQTITDADLAAVTIGGNVTYKPGVKMVKITTDPKVYAVDAHGTLRHVATEAVAVALYGATWASMVNDVPDAFFVNYTVGTAVAAAADFAKDTVAAAATSINVDKNLSGTVATPATGTITVSDGGSPAAASVPLTSTNVIFAKVKFAGTGTVTGLKVTRSGLGADASFTGVKLFDGTTQLGTTQTLNAVHQASFTGLSVAVAGEKILTIAGEITGGATHAGEILVLSVASAADVTLASGTVGGTFPITGNGMSLVNLASGIGSATLYRGALMPTSDSQPAPDSVDFRFTQVRIQAGSVEDITVRQITAIQSGTATTADLKDIKLQNDTLSKLEGSVATLASNGRAVFDGLNIIVKKGESVNLSILATLTGSPSNRTVGFELHDGVAYTIQIVGNTYGFGITPAANASNDFCATAGASGNVLCQIQTVAGGTLRLARATSSPATGKVAQGGTQVPLLAVDYTVTGESVRITSQTIGFAFGGGPFLVTELTNVTLYDASGTAVAGPSNPSGTAVTFTDTVNVPVGTTTYTLKGNIASATSASDTVAASLCLSSAAAANGCATTQTMTVKGISSGKTTTVSTTSNVVGATQTVQAGALAATTGATPIAGSVVAGVQDFTFANATLDASSGGEDVKVSSLQVADTTGASAIPGDLINWELWGDLDTSDTNDAIARIETTNSTATATYTANTAGIDSTVTFTLKTPLRVSKNKSMALMVKADVISGATAGATAAFAHVVDVSVVSATGWTTGTSITMTDGTHITGAGQAQIVRASGTLKVELAADTATAGPIVAGSSGVSLVKYKLTSAFEDVDITALPIYLADGAVAAGTRANVAKVKVYKSGVLVGNLAGYEVNNSSLVIVTLDSGAFRVVKDVPIYFELKADFNSKEQAASGTRARLGIGDQDGLGTTGLGTALNSCADAGDCDAGTWGTTRAGAAGSYAITANGKDSGTTITDTNIDSIGDGSGVVAGGDAFGIFDGVLTVGLASGGGNVEGVAPSGVQTAGLGKEVLRFWLTATGDEITIHDLGILVSGSASDAATNGSGAISASATGDATLTNPDRSTTYATWVTGDTVDSTPLDPTSGALHVNTNVNTTNDAGWDQQIVVGAGQTKTISLNGDTTGAGGAATTKSLQYRIDTYTSVVPSGVMWYDDEISTKGSANCPAAASYDNGADNADDSTSSNTVRAGDDRCVVQSATYTKTLPVNGSGLSYN